MISKEKKIQIADRIIASNTFKNAPTSIAILRYLIEANIENRPLKESIIDIEFFGGESATEKSNPRVRVNVYNLRKKLNSYYETEGVGDNWRVIIDKGQYSIRFEEQNQKKKKAIKSNKKQILPYSLLLIVMFVFVFSHLPNRKPELWKGFFTNSYNTNLFIGDAFGYGGKTVSGSAGWTRDFSINSADEYYAMLEEQPELKVTTSPSDFFYSTRMAENATHDLSRFFTRWDSDFEIKYDTRTSFLDIKKGNTIYVGRLKDQKNFIYLFNEANSFFKINDRTIIFSGHPTISDTTFSVHNVDTELDFAVVSRIPGPNNTEQFLFFSDHDIGIMATVEFFTSAKSLKKFTTEHLNGSPYFTAIYKAKGKERINLSLEPIMIVPFDN